MVTELQIEKILEGETLTVNLKGDLISKAT